MANEVTTNFDLTPFLLDGAPIVKDDAVIKQDAARTTTLKAFTLMAQIAATGKWVPFTNETAVDGSAYPAGIYVGADIAAATLKAGDVSNCQIVVRGDPTSIYDSSKLVIENSKLLTTVIGANTVYAKSVKQALVELGILFAGTTDIDAYENT